jgi:hypothetical protein
MAAFLSFAFPRGTTIVAGSPSRLAAKGTLWPWLPRVAATTPRTPGSRARSSRMYTSPPRGLNDPVGRWFSCFSQSSAPVRRASSGQAICGVGGSTS